LAQRWNLYIRKEKMSEEFGCILGCMDGRTKEAAIRFMQEKFGVRWVDMITKPGMDKILADPKSHAHHIRDIKYMLSVSVKRHGTKIVGIEAHPHCAGNPVNKQTHVDHLAASIETVESFGLGIKIVPFWVHEDWQTVEEIAQNLVQVA
jgi:hypothetical protein